MRLTGDDVRSLREQLKEDQSTFGRRFLVSRRTVIRWEQRGHAFGLRRHGGERWDEVRSLRHAEANAGRDLLNTSYTVYWRYGSTRLGVPERDEQAARDLAAEAVALGADDVRVLARIERIEKKPT